MKYKYLSGQSLHSAENWTYVEFPNLKACPTSFTVSEQTLNKLFRQFCEAMDPMWTRMMQMIPCDSLAIDDSFKIRKIVYAGASDTPVFHGQKTIMNHVGQVAAYAFMRTGTNKVFHSAFMYNRYCLSNL